MITKTVDVDEAKTRLPELVSSVETGAEIILTKDNTPVARLVPLAVAAMNRVAGLHAGSSWMSPDFNEPLPDNAGMVMTGY